jgi:hypothetical protein
MVMRVRSPSKRVRKRRLNEDANAVDVVVEEIDAIRRRRSHRIKIEQRAAHRAFAGRHHLRDMRVAGGRESCAKVFRIEFLTLLDREGMRIDVRARREPLQQRLEFHDDDGRTTLRQTRQ